jgi:tetratricopeptide (TPR) repeat protein
MTKPRHIFACALLLGAAACSNAPAGGGSAKESYARGLAALEQGQPRTARVELMNAIQADPNNGAIRVAQARTYLSLSDGVAAEAEIERARKLGVAVDDTRHLLAHALLLRNEPKRALEELNGVPAAHAGYAARLRGQALAKLGDTAGAAAAFKEAIAADPKDNAAWTEVARFRRGTGDLAGAVEAADRALKINAKDIEALTLRGELTRSQYGLRAALPWFDRALEIDPNNIPAMLERAATLGDLGDTKAMLAETRKVLKLSENHPMAFYLQAMIAARAKKYELARTLYQRTGGALDGEPAGMLLASAIDYQTGNVEQAANRLEKLIGMQPYNRKARRMLAAAQFKLGDNEATIRTLRPLADRPDADSYTLALIGKAIEKQGDTQAASRYLARAAQPQRRASTALWANPVSDDQLIALRRFAASKPGHAPSQVLLIGGLLSRGMGQEALDLALKLQADNPGAPDAHILVGDARGMGGDFKGAAAEYGKAANLAFNEPVAMRMIEALQRSGQGPAAAKVLNLFLEQNPRSVPAQILAATGFLQARQWGEAIRIYEGLRQRLGDRDAVMLNNLAWAYSEQGNYGKAIPLAQKAWSLDKDNPATADTLGWLLYKSGKDKAQGLVLLERASRGAPTDAQIRQHLDAARRG